MVAGPGGRVRTASSDHFLVQSYTTTLPGDTCFGPIRRQRPPAESRQGWSPLRCVTEAAPSTSVVHQAASLLSMLVTPSMRGQEGTSAVASLLVRLRRRSSEVSL